MRVALLSTLEPATDAATPRGLLRVGGRAIIQHQLGAAIAFGCERILCLADAHSSEIVALQRLAERGGLTFRILSNGHDLARQVLPQDEVLVFADGLLAAPKELAALAEVAQGLLCQPAERGLAAGFERIDLDHATAGVLRLPGILLTRLASLPSDWSPVSALLRIAAQAELPRLALPASLPDEGRWGLVRSEAEAQAFETRWLRLHTAGAVARGPGAWLAAELVQRLGPELLHSGARPRLVILMALILAVSGVGLGWAGFFAGGFVLLGLSWLVNDCAELLLRIDRESLPLPRRRFASDALFAWLLDSGFVFGVAVRLEQPGEYALAPIPAGFLALTLFGLLRLLPRIFTDRAWAPWCEDRFLAGMLLFAVSLTDVFAPSLMAASLLMIALALVSTEPRPRGSGR